MSPDIPKWVARSADFFERSEIVCPGTFRVVPDVIGIVLDVSPLAYFRLTIYPHLKTVQFKERESVWKKLGVEL